MKLNITGSAYIRYVVQHWKCFFRQNGAFHRALQEVLAENEKLKIENILM